MRTSLALVLFCACGTDPQPVPVDPDVPEDISAFVEVRNCRASSDHDLQQIRVLADPAGLGPYNDHMAPFPIGTIILKPQYDFADTNCTGPVQQWTVMRRTDDVPADHLGWSWQRVDADRKVTTLNDSRCYACHSDCGVAPRGYLGTCTEP